MKDVSTDLSKNFMSIKTGAMKGKAVADGGGRDTYLAADLTELLFATTSGVVADLQKKCFVLDAYFTALKKNKLPRQTQLWSDLDRE